MIKAVLDSSVLVSAFLSRTGVSRQLLQYTAQEGVEFYVSDQILSETERVLNYERLRKRYPYYDEDIVLNRPGFSGDCFRQVRQRRLSSGRLKEMIKRLTRVSFSQSRHSAQE